MNTDFAAILKTYRQRERLSQSELAGKLGISRNYVSLIERGVRDNISWRLGCKILDLCIQLEHVSSGGVHVNLQGLTDAGLLSENSGA